MKKHSLTMLLILIVTAELAGALSALLSGGGFGAYYASLVQPPFSPPGWIFPVAWGILYALMGISSYLIWQTEDDSRMQALRLYGVQLLVNMLWSPVFFGLRSHVGATVVVLLMLVLVIAMVLRFGKIRKSAAQLNVPYLLWTMYASYLTVGVLALN